MQTFLSSFCARTSCNFLKMLRLFLFFLHAVLFLPCGVLSKPVQPEYDVNNLHLVQNLFENFIVTYNRSYSGTEKIQRFGHFRQNLALINELNSKYPDAVFDINNFADWSTDEKNPPKPRIPLRHNIKRASKICSRIHVKSGMFKKAPASFDWKNHGAVTPVKNQGQCGSCWAHAIVGSVEGQYAIKNKRQVVLSEQQLVDCIDKVNSCSGALLSDGYRTVIKEGGLMLQSDYQYTAQQQKCRFNKSKIAAKVNGCRLYETNKTEAPLKDILYNVGPLTLVLDAEGFPHYKSGIFTGKNCAFNELNHAVLLTGYGSDNGIDFWNIKNSYGESFGENGYIRVQRGIKCLGIGEEATTSAVIG